MADNSGQSRWPARCKRRIRERVFAGSFCLSAVSGTQVWHKPVHKPPSCPKAHAATSAGGPPPRTLPHASSSPGCKAGHRDNANPESPWSCGRQELATRGAASYSCCGAMLWPCSGSSARHGCEVCCGARRSAWSPHAASTAQVCARRCSKADDSKPGKYGTLWPCMQSTLFSTFCNGHICMRTQI